MSPDLPPGITRRGDKYRATVYLGLDPVSGRKTRRSRTFTNRKDAERWLREQRAGRGAPRGSGETLGDLLEAWLGRQRWRVEVDESLEAATLSWYRSAVERHIAPTPIARARLRDLTSDQLQAFLAGKRERGSIRAGGEGRALGRSSVRRLAVVLNAALSWAHREGWVSSNPAESARLVATRGSERARELEWSIEDLRTFLKYHNDHRMASAWRLQAITGARRGEILGLKWSDLAVPDIGQATITVRRAWVMVDGRPVLKAPKTEGSIRTVPIDAETVEALEAWRSTQDRDRAAWGWDYQSEGWIFTREDGSPHRPDTYTAQLKRACAAAGVPVVTPQTLRHLVGTLLLEAGVATRVVSDVLGHSSTRVTSEIYQHVRESLAAQAVGRISDQLGGGEGGTGLKSAPIARQSEAAGER